MKIDKKIIALCLYRTFHDVDAEYPRVRAFEDMDKSEKQGYLIMVDIMQNELKSWNLKIDFINKKSPEKGKKHG